MEGSVLVELVTRITALEAKVGVSLGEISNRLQALENADRQRASDKEQAERMETANLRNELTRLKADAEAAAKAAAEDTATPTPAVAVAK